MIQPTQNIVAKKTLRETIRAQKAAIHTLEANMRILLVMIEALRMEYNLSKEKVEEISDRFINQQVDRTADGKIDVEEFLGAADGLKEQLTKLKDGVTKQNFEKFKTPDEPKAN